MFTRRLEQILNISFGLLGKRLSLKFINLLLKCPYDNIFSNRIIHLLLNNIDDVPIKTRNGFIMQFKQSGRSTNIRKGFITGVHDRTDLNIMRKFLEPGDYVIDIGANEGYISLFLGSIVGRGGKVFSIEPDKQNLFYLKNNIQYNDSNIEIIEKAMSNEITESDFLYDDNMGPWGGLESYSKFGTNLKKAVKVEVDTLDNIFKCSGRRIKFVKVDTEGNELNVFLGAKKFIKEHQPIVYFEVHTYCWSYHDCSVETLFNIFKNNGYDLFIQKNGLLHEFEQIDAIMCNIFAIPKSVATDFREMKIIIK